MWATDPQWVPMRSDFNSHWCILSSYFTMWMLLSQRGVVQNKPFLKINLPINAIYCLFLSNNLKYLNWKNSQELNLLCNPAPIICYKVGQLYPRVWLAGLFSSCLECSSLALIIKKKKKKGNTEDSICHSLVLLFTPNSFGELGYYVLGALKTTVWL